MEPCFIALKLDKFQICSCPGCNYDAANEVSAKLKNGIVYYLASCERGGHKKRTKDVKGLLEQGIPVSQLHTQGLINQEEVFIQPFEKDQKCKFLQWKEFLANPPVEEPVPEPPAVAQAQQRNDVTTHRVCDNWTWESRMGWWRRADGTRVRIEKLPLDEFVGSIQAIQKVNFSRITKRIAWIKQLEGLKVSYEYPPKVMDVGYAEAGRKLEEFEEDAETRGLL